MTKRRKSNRKWWLISASIIALAVIITFAYLNQPTTGIKQSSSYFLISDPAAAGRYLAGNSTVVISTLGFNFTPIGGDAHNVALFLKGMTPAIEHTFPFVGNGTSTSSGEIDIPYSLPVSKYPDGYHLTIRIRCDEADGNITMVIPEGDMFISSAPPS